MQKFFCDKCGEECASNSSAAKKFDKLTQSSDNSFLGLQVTPLWRGEINAGSHICNNCMPELLILAARTYTDSGVVAKQQLMQADAKNYQAMKRILEKQLDLANKREKAAEVQLVEAAKCIADAEEQRLADKEKINVLEAQVKSLQVKLDTTVRIKAAADKQLEVDKEENPEYARAIQRRQRVRLS